MISVPSISFGDLEIEENKIYTFAQGIPGIKNCSKYTLLDFEENSPFMWLQACEPPYLSILGIDPATIAPDFEVPFSPANAEELKIESLDHVFMLAPVVVPENPREMTANLLAPFIFNYKTLLARQIVVNGGSPDLLRVRVIVD